MFSHMGGGEHEIFVSPRTYMGWDAQNFSKPQSLYGRSEFFQVPKLIWGGELKIFPSPEAYMGGGAHNISKSQNLYGGRSWKFFQIPKPKWGKSLEFSQVPEPVWECQIQYIDISS